MYVQCTMYTINYGSSFMRFNVWQRQIYINSVLIRVTSQSIPKHQYDRNKTNLQIHPYNCINQWVANTLFELYIGFLFHFDLYMHFLWYCILCCSVAVLFYSSFVKKKKDASLLLCDVSTDIRHLFIKHFSQNAYVSKSLV